MTIGPSAIASGPAAAPARRLLAAFCMLAGDLWLASDKVRCEIHGGRFEPQEIGPLLGRTRSCAVRRLPGRRPTSPTTAAGLSVSTSA